MTDTPTRPATWRRPTTWIALLVLVVSVGMAAFSLASVLMADRDALGDRPDALAVILTGTTFISLLVVGAVLSILRPANPIGWLFLASGTLFLTGIFATDYAGRADIFGVDLPAVEFVRWLGGWAEPLGLVLALVFIPLLFPDGHPPGPRWRTFGIVAAALVAISTITDALVTDPLGGTTGLLPDRLVGGAIQTVSTFVRSAWDPIVQILGLLALGSLAQRFHRSSGIERQQLKWFLFAVGTFIVTLVIGIATAVELIWYFVLIAFAAMPIAAGIAVLRYRLYDIDRIISRTVAYAVVTTALAALFVLVVVGLQQVLARSLIGGSTIAVAASTLIVAAVFQPLRRRVQRVVDRRFDRARYDGERTTAAFAERLRDEVDLERLQTALVAAADETVRPARADIWLR
jgi:hypothetical protein